MSEPPLGPNPYVGPRPFRLGEPLFGRDAEVRDLYYLLSAERIALLHSPSGAGKSSLVYAGLIPRLKHEEFDVWPVIRVSAEPPEGSPANRYIYSAILGMEDELPEQIRRDASTLRSMTLAQYVSTRPRKKGAPPNLALIFDQFEEILTVDPVSVDAKTEFFAQLGELLRDRRIWALFVIREDYLAPLDPYVALVPTQLKNRFRLDLLGLEAAGEAIRRPAETAGREFTPGAAGRLVRDLAQVSVQRPDGSFHSQDGRTVEPVQLQVVCRRLWDEMPPEDRVIDPEDLRFGDVTQALGAYYDHAVQHAGEGHRSQERAIREWFSDKLVTRGRIRGQVLQGTESSDGLDNRVIFRLLDTHLIRAEKRRGATWFELAHDRLIEPVVMSNALWFAANLEEFQGRALIWEQTGQRDEQLLTGQDLANAEAWLAQGNRPTAAEERFLAASRRRQAALDTELKWQKQKKRQRRWTIGTVAAALVTGLVVLAFFGGQLQEAADARQARDGLFMFVLHNVVEFNVLELVGTGPVPGEVAPMDPSDPAWITLVDGKLQGGNEDIPFAIARSFGSGNQGRVVAVGHDGFLFYSNDEDDNVFLDLVLKWLDVAEKRKIWISMKPTDAIVKYDTPERQLVSGLKQRVRRWEYDMQDLADLSDSVRLGEAGVLIIGNAWGEFTDAELDAIQRFVEDGGGLLTVGLGWSWQYYGPSGVPNKQPASLDDYPMNELMEHFGAHWTGRFIASPEKSASSVQ